MTDIPPPADDRVHSAADDEKAVEDAKKLEKSSDLTQDEQDRLDAHL